MQMCYDLSLANLVSGLTSFGAEILCARMDVPWTVSSEGGAINVQALP